MSKPVILLDAGQLVGLSGTTDGDVLTWNGTAWVSSPGGGVGTVTSVALDTASTGLTVSGGTTQTITGSGTFTLGGTLDVPNGGTGLSSVAEGSLLYASGADVLAAGTLSDLNWSSVAPTTAVAITSALGTDVSLAGGDITAGGNVAEVPGGIIILSGNQLVDGATRRAGDLLIDSGTSAAGGGYVRLGTNSASLVTIGRDTVTTSINGDLSLQNALAPSYGGTGLAAPAVGDVGKLLTATALGTYELATLPNVGTAGTYGSASSVPVFTTDAQGRVSAVTDTSIGISTAQVTGLDTALGTFALKTTTISAGTGLSGGGDLSANRTISMPSVGSAGTYGSASSVAVVTTDAQGRVSGATTTSIAVTQSQVSGLATALDAKADKSIQIAGGTGIVVANATGTLANNSLISLDGAFLGQANQGSATKTVTLSTDIYGRVTSITQQNIAGLNASVITAGLLSVANGGTGVDASAATQGKLLITSGGGAYGLQNISGDATMLSSGAVTVTGLRTNPVSATVLGAVDAGKALVWSGSAWQATNIQGGGGGGLIYFMNYAASSPYPLSTVFDQNAGWNTGPIPVQNDATGTTLATFVTASGVPGIEVIPAGLWDVNFYAASDALANEVAVRFNVVTISGVTATVIATSDYVYLSDPSVVNNYIATVYVPATDVALTDRLQIVLEGRRFTGDARTITTYFGTGSITHAHTTINAPGGTGLVKVVDGFIQTPATLLVNADVSATAAVAVAKLAAGTNSYVLTTVAGVPTWQAPAATGVTTLTGTGNQVLVNGGFGTPVSGAVTLTLPQAIGTSSGPTFSTLTLSTLANGILKATGGTGSIQSGFVSLTTEVGGVLPITKGGTNLTSSGASGNLLVSDGSSWASVAMAGDATIISSGTITLANTGSAGTYGSASSVPVFVTDVKGRVTSVTNTSIAIGAGAITSGTLNTTRGGTGVSNPSTGTLLLGAGASAMTSLSGVDGDTIIWSGSTWTASPLSSNAVTSLTAVSGGGVTLSGSTGAVTVSVGQSVATSASPSFAGLTLTGLTGYLKGNGASVVSASSTIPVADVTGAAPLNAPTFTGTVTIPAGASISGYATTASLASYAPLASPTFTGTPLSTTAAVDNDTTQIATTAYVVGQGYLKSATASSIYAPLASPTFTGIVTIPAGASIAGYLTTATAASTYAPLASPTFTGTVTIPSGASISGFATLASPTFTGTPAAPTPLTADSSTTIATTAFVKAQGYLTSIPAQPYDLSGEFVGTPVASAAIMRFVAARSFTFGGTAYFAATSNTGATAAVFTVNVNGVSKGTVSIAGNATSGTGAITSTLIAAGDIITVVATTIGNVISPYWTLPGTV